MISKAKQQIIKSCLYSEIIRIALDWDVKTTFHPVKYTELLRTNVVHTGGLVDGGLASKSKDPGLDPRRCHPMWNIRLSICPRYDKYDLK